MAQEEIPDPKFAFNCEEVNIGYQLDKWNLDSGSSHHHAKDKTYLHNKYKPFNGTITIKGRESLDIGLIGTHNTYGEVKLVKVMGRKVFQLVR